MEINVFFRCDAPLYIRKKQKFFSCVLFKVLGKNEGETNLIFVNNKEIKKLNKTYLGKNRSTDVIAFRYKSMLGDKAKQPFGDIFICFDTAKMQSKKMGHSLLKELLILLIHGALHLLGMKDSTKKERLAMEKLTDNILNKVYR